MVVGGSAASNPQAQLGLAGSNNGSNLHIARNLFTYEDRVTADARTASVEFGAWFQQFQSNETIALSQYGQATFASLPNVSCREQLRSFLFDPAPTEMNWRSLLGRVLCARCHPHQFEAHSVPRFPRRIFDRVERSARPSRQLHVPNGVISNQPRIADSLFTTNNANFLPQPRIALAWSPLGSKTVIRAGFGMYNDLQDALGYRADQNAPFNPAYTHAISTSRSFRSIPPRPFPAAAKLVPGGVQPDMQTPTLISYSLRVQRELSPNTSLTVGYVGSHGYHELIGIDANEPFPVICPASPCPATYPQRISRRNCEYTCPGGSLLCSRQRSKPIPRSRIPGRGFRRKQFLQRTAGRRESPSSAKV